MKYKIYKILFVFAILFANIAPAPAAMTLDEYWKNADADPDLDTSMWNQWAEDIDVGNNKVNLLWNIDCSTSDNECCTFITDPTGDYVKKLSVDAYYTKETKWEDAINGTATPIKCTYIPNDCFACNFTINDNNKITAKCFNALNQLIHGAEYITCPTPPNDTGFYAECEFDYYDDKEINGLGLEIHNYNCKDSCPSLMTYDVNNNICQCPNNADCSDPDDIKCLAGYYDSTPIGDILTCTYCPAGSYCPGDVGINSKILCPAGSYCPAGAPAPTTCNAGTYSTGGASQCTQCDAGTYSTGGTSQCTPCDAGTYCPAGSSNPINCPAGSYCPDGKNKNTCDAGTYCPAGSSNPIQCPAGSYCPDGKDKKTCTTPWSLSALSAKREQECYVTLAELQYIKDDKTLSVTTTDKCPEGYACPGGDVYYPNYGKVECQYNAPQEDSPTNINQWLKNICPLAQSTSAITDIRLIKSWKTGAVCYADMILETTCGQIVTEAIPQATNGKYLTWNGTAETRPNAHYYKTITAGLYAKNLYTDTYCTSDPSHYQLYKNAVICPAGKYCKGYTTTPQCAGTNPTEYSPNGDVAGGYYSTGGADNDKPTGTGNGCLTGYKCGKTAVGYYSTGGGTTDIPTETGNGCLTGYKCGECPPGINCPAGSATNDNKCRAGYYCDPDEKKCPAGSTSDAGQYAETGCYIMGGDDGTGFCVNSKCFNIQTNVNYNNTPIPSN